MASCYTQCWSVCHTVPAPVSSCCQVKSTPAFSKSSAGEGQAPMRNTGFWSEFDNMHWAKITFPYNITIKKAATVKQLFWTSGPAKKFHGSHDGCCVIRPRSCHNGLKNCIVISGHHGLCVHFLDVSLHSNITQHCIIRSKDFSTTFILEL